MRGNPFSDIPTEVRRWAYIVYTLLLVTLGAIQVGYGTSSSPTPEWLEVAFAVLGYLGIAFGFTAVSNVGREPLTVAAEADEPYEYDEEDDVTILSEIDPPPDHLDEGAEDVGEGQEQGQGPGAEVAPGGGGAADPRRGGPLP